MREQPRFLPISLAEAQNMGIEQFDVVLINGDAYVDHPSFGVALMGRVLWDAGYSVGIIAQPDWKKSDDFVRLGEPRLFFGISSGNVDSMVNNYTPNLKRRSQDVYSARGLLHRPDRATIVYANKVHALFPATPVILGGLEASLRRFAHYDYWSNSVRQSILADAPADLLVFGMGELPLIEVTRRLDKGERIQDITDIPGTVVKEEARSLKIRQQEDLVIPGYQEVSSDKTKYAEAFRLHYQEQDPLNGRIIVQPHPKTLIIQNKPARPLNHDELDHIYELPYKREAHPSYQEPVPALEPVKFSITSHRGCFGSCSFCSLTHHQGRIVQSRSIESIVREARGLTRMKGFKGIIQDIGGPTANMYGLKCANWKYGACRDKFCNNCPSLEKDHRFQVKMLRRLRALPGVKKIFISSGIRHDLVLEDSSGYLKEICQHHISGHLKIAPEHVAFEVTECMNKPPVKVMDAFRKSFDEMNEELGKEQYILPYFMSGHPGCTITDMIELAEYIRDNKMYTEQVQDFTPTPMTISTTMFYTGLDPFTMQPVHVPKGKEKRIQRALLHYRNAKNYSLVREGLKLAGREDLIGSDMNCLIPPRLNKKQS
ncbi:MAG: YgiQ family radical SAM protein [Methanotrichaceae archaeon]|nr:YgiQ family radical SAM protein [Methanotrichaceae archaeon]MDD1757343.1 YgiQ family radical SAM protein [Methanotrichaceae archaeon]